MQQSKELELQAKKMPVICTRDSEKAVMGYSITKILLDEGLNAHSFRHTHVTDKIDEDTVEIFTKIMQTNGDC